MKGLSLFLILIIISVFTFSLLGEEVTLYKEDFEIKDPVVFWTSNGDYKVNFKGLSKEKSYSGEKSFKLDITLKSGTYNYWKIPIEFPLLEGTTLIAHFAVEKIEPQTKIWVGIGRRIKYPYVNTGCKLLRASASPTDWLEVRKNLGKRELVEKEARKYLRGYKPMQLKEEFTMDYLKVVEPLLDNYYIGISSGEKKGFSGERMIVYLDAVKIVGHKEKVEKYKNFKERWKKKWEERKEQLINHLVKTSYILDENLKEVKKLLEEKKTSLGEKDLKRLKGEYKKLEKNIVSSEKDIKGLNSIQSWLWKASSLSQLERKIKKLKTDIKISSLGL